MGASAELVEVREFLAAHAPFDELPQAELLRVVGEIRIEYFRRGTPLIARGADNHHLFVLRSGAVDVKDRDDELVERCDAGTTFGSITLTHGNPSTFEVAAIEDSLAYLLPAETFYRLIRDHPAVARFFSDQRAARMRPAVDALSSSTTGDAVLRIRAAELVRREPVCATASTTIRDAAATMAEQGVSALLIMDDDRLAGILTDRDLRSRVLAVGLEPTRPVSEVMTPDPITASPEALAFELMLAMVERMIHHLPLVADGRPVGVVTSTDLLRLERSNPVHLVRDVAKQADVTGLATVGRRLPGVVERLVGHDASADDIGRIVTTVGDAVERRLIALAEQRLGPPPVPYCWVTLGSRARMEQALAADQDHAMILHDDATEADGAWFADLARLVTDGLEECGYRRCPGDVMAVNDRWRLPLRQWRQQFTTWLTEPTPEATLQASIFFDMRPVAGDASLHARLAADVHEWTLSAQAFLLHLVKRAAAHEPPLGIFRGLVVERKGEHRDTLDIKWGGVAAVVELARVHALAAGVADLGTRSRLAAAAAAGRLEKERAHDLQDAFEFVSYLRLRHQAQQVRAGLEPDNHLAPSQLSRADQRHLRDAFGIIRSAQAALVRSYPALYYVS
jgi:CBS domain-containing protein